MPSPTAKVLSFSFDNGYRDVRLVVEDVIGAACLASGCDAFSTNGYSALCKRDLFANLRVNVPAGGQHCGSDVFCADISFAEGVV